MDQSIANAIANPAAIKLDDPLERYGNFLKVQHLNDEIRAARRVEDRSNRLGAALKKGGGKRAETRNALIDDGLGDLVPDFDESQAKIDKLGAETKHAEMQATETRGKAIAQRLDMLRDNMLRGVPKNKSGLPMMQKFYDALAADDVVGPYFTGQLKWDPNYSKKTAADAAAKGDAAFASYVFGEGMSLKNQRDQQIKILEEQGRNARNAADIHSREGIASAGRASQQSIAAAGNQSREGIAARGVASHEALAKLGFDFKRWQNDERYATDMMTRGRVASQILKKEFPWINVGTIGKRSLEEQQKLWDGAGHDPRYAAKPGTSLHGMGAAIDFGHGLNISKEQIAKLKNRATELGIELYDESGSPNGAHQHGTIVSPPDLPTLRRMLNGNDQLVVDPTNHLVPRVAGQAVRGAAVKPPNFQNQAIAEFDRLYKDVGLFIGNRMATDVEKKKKIAQIREELNTQWEVENGLRAPGPDVQGDDSWTAEDLSKAVDWLQQERLRSSQINRNNARSNGKI